MFLIDVDIFSQHVTSHKMTSLRLNKLMIDIKGLSFNH